MANTKPCNDNRAITEMMMSGAKSVGRGVRLLPFGALTKGLAGEELAEMGDMRKAGAIGVSDDGVCVMNAAVMRRALEYARTFDLLVSQHCEDHHLTAGAQMHEGAVATKLGLKGWPREAEDIIVARDIILNERIGARYHVAHLSTKGAARLVGEAKSRGLSVTAEVTPHHLTMTEQALVTYDTHCKVNPPLRSEEDRAALIAALADGTIDCIATDHAPHSSLEKDCEFSASPGMIGLETTIPLHARAGAGAVTSRHALRGGAVARAPAHSWAPRRGHAAASARAATWRARPRPALDRRSRERSAASRSTPPGSAKRWSRAASTKTIVGGEVVFDV